VALSVSSLLSTFADSKLQLGGGCPLKTPAFRGAISPTSKLVGFLAHFYKNIELLLLKKAKPNKLTVILSNHKGDYNEKTERFAKN
jgi:hypothetical protein